MGGVIKLGDLFLQKGKSVNPAKFIDEVFELYSIPAYDRGQPDIVKGCDIGSSKKALEPNDVIISRIVPHIRRCWIVGEFNDKRQIGSGEWIVFRSKKVYPRFLRFYLLSNPFNRRFMNTIKGVGGSLLRADPKQVAKFQIKLPPLAEQKRIANILDQADQLRQLNQQILAEYDALTKSLFLDMFGDPVVNPMGWEIIKIADVVDEVKYGTSLKAGEVGKYPYLRMNNITYTGYMDYSSLKYIDVNEKEYPKYSVQEGDLLFNRTNSKELVGKTGLITDDINRIIAGYLIRVRVSDAYNPYYVWRHLNSEWAKLTLRSMCKSIVGMANINAKELQKIKILKAPLELQNKFAEKIKNIEAQKANAQAALAASEDLFNNLLQKAFKGEL